jgi:hypothetical protein
MYSGKVNDSIDKVSITSSANGLRKFGVADGFKTRLEILDFSSEDNPYVEFKGDRYPATNMEVKILKALTLEQVNKNESYSKTVTSIFMQLLKAVVDGSHKPVWTCMDDNVMPKVVFREITSYIDKLLEEDK